MTTAESVATINQRTPYHAISINGCVSVFGGFEHDAEVVLRLSAISDELLARMVMAFVEICEKGIIA